MVQGARMTDDVVLEVHDLSVALGPGHSLDGLNFSIGAGESVALFGPSGVGKSCLVETLCSLRLPMAGRVLCHATQSVVFQETPVFQELSVAENVVLTEIESAASQPAPPAELAHVLGTKLSQRWRHKPGALSGGERRVLALCRAVYKLPGLLILDEPTAGLDPARIGELARQLLDLQAACGFALLTVTHDLALAARIGTRFLLLTAAQPHLRECAAEAVAPAERTEWQVDELADQLLRASRSPGDSAACRLPTGPASVDNGRASSLRRRASPLQMPPIPLIAAGLTSTARILALAMVPAGLLLGLFGALRTLAATAQLDMEFRAPEILGRLLFGEGGSTFVGVVFAGTAAAALASRLGLYRLQRHRDTVVLAGYSPVVFWGIPAALAHAVCFPLLGTAAIVIASAVAAWPMHWAGIPAAGYMHRFLGGVRFEQAAFLLVMLAVHGLAVGAVGYALGMRRKSGQEAVGRDTTLAVLAAICAVVLLEALFRGRLAV